MNKAKLILAALILATVGGSVLSASASHCGTGNGHDPFGSCEQGTPGHAKCDSSPDVPISGVGSVSTPSSSSNKGVEACAEDSSALPIAGRLGVYNDSGKTVIFLDGDDVTNSGGAAAWDRVEIYNSGKVCVKRGSGGQWSTNGSGTGESSAEISQCTP